MEIKINNNQEKNFLQIYLKDIQYKYYSSNKKQKGIYWLSWEKCVDKKCVDLPKMAHLEHPIPWHGSPEQPHHPTYLKFEKIYGHS